MGGNWYSRSKEGIFEVPKPLSSLGIGVDALPKEIRLSNILTGNDLGMLGNVEKLPKRAANFISTSEKIHKLVQKLLCEGNVSEAWELLLTQ
jgi:hypothetical protein